MDRVLWLADANFDLEIPSVGRLLVVASMGRRILEGWQDADPLSGKGREIIAARGRSGEPVLRPRQELLAAGITVTEPGVYS
jgi:hypothetical protein